MASNVADSWLFFPAQGASTVTEIDLTSTGIKGVYVIPSRCQVKEWGVIVTTVFVTWTVEPIIRLERRPIVTGTAVVIQALTLGDGNTTLRKYTTNPDLVGAGGPGTVTVGPSLGGHTVAATSDANLGVVGNVILGDTKSLPSVVLQAGDALQVNVNTAGTVGSGQVVAFVRLEVAGEQYTTAFVQYDATP